MSTVEILQSLTLRPKSHGGQGWLVEVTNWVLGTPMTRTKVEEYPTIEDALGAIADHVGVKTAIIPGKAGVP